MAIRLYNPFESLHFNPEECFLTSEKISSTEEQISVFLEWIINEEMKVFQYSGCRSDLISF